MSDAKCRAEAHYGTTRSRLLIAAILFSAASFSLRASDAADDLRGMRYLDNGSIRLGVDLDRGGAITYLSLSGRDENVVNNYDLGRQIQMSFYSGPVPFTAGDKKPQPHWNHIGWNPIQSGDDFGHGSRVRSFKLDDSRHVIELSCIPMQWPLDGVAAECEFEHRIELREASAFVTARIRNHRADKTQYKARHQELPAVYANAPYYRLVSYTGARPFANDARLTYFDTTDGKGMPWRHFHPTESWAALLRDDDFGIGVFHFECYEFAGGFSGPTGKGGERDAPTGYLAPVRREIIDHDSRFEYEYALTLGTLGEIRSRFVAENTRRKQRPGTSKPAPDAQRRPDYQFLTDRRHWYYENARDSGLPITGELVVAYDAADPQLLSPVDFWQAADAPRLYISAAFRQSSDKARLFWQRLDQVGFTEQQAVDFPIVPDGRMRTYEINLATHAEYRGAITGLRLDPTERVAPGDGLCLRAITAERPKHD